MAVNFSALALSPAIAVFGKPVTFTPAASQPAAEPYQISGIWEEQHIDIQLDQGGVLSANNLDLGVRLHDFAAVPRQNDIIAISDTTLWRPELIGTYLVDDIKPDGQGGAKLVLKRQ
jgi:hypothetical protein